MRSTIQKAICFAGVLLFAATAWAQDAPQPAKKAPPINKKRDERDVTKLNKEGRAKELKFVKKLGDLFRITALQYLGEVRSVVRKRYRERRKLIVGGYETQISKLEKKEELARRKAIQYFLAFIKKYPNHKRFTPDAMYRLAELYYEEEYNGYLSRSKQYEKDLQRFDNKEIPEAPIAPKKQFPQTILWLGRLIQEFPRYRFAAGAYYLLGYCKGEEDKEEEATQYFKAITEKYPNSPLVAEAWIRLGESYFRNNKRQEAKQAYQQVLKYPKHQMYDKALYKLAWTHYLLDEFDQAVSRFTDLLEFYLKKKKEGVRGVGDLRKEAIQYIAISFADEKWGSPQKAEQYLRKVGLKKPYSREILLQLSKNYSTQGNWNMVVAVNRQMLQLYPYHPDNPFVQAQIIRAYEQKRELNNALLERDALIKNFGPDSAWRKKNATNIRAQRAINRILSKNIYRTAIFRHETCNVFRKRMEEAKEEEQKKAFKAEAVKNCKMAARNYKEFLTRFPHHKEAYNLTWYLADSLSFAGQHEESVKYFRKVRDWPGEKKYFQEAAFSLIDSLVRKVSNRCKAGMIKRACEHPDEEKKKKEEKKDDKDKKDKKKKQDDTSLRRKKIEKLPIPDLQKELIKARKFYLKNVQDKQDKRIPAQLYLMARIYYAYDHLVVARKLLWEFIKTYPNHKLIQEAGDSIVASYRREGKLDKMLSSIRKIKRISNKFKASYQRKLEVGVAYIKAKKLQDEGKNLEAAKAYEKAVRKNPKHKDAPAALWNAALLYEKENRYGSAQRIYEKIVSNYPKWKLADQALFLVAYNAEKYFNFNTAVRKYMKLVNDRNFKESKKRPDALYNAALLLENLQRYEEAAKAYRRYAQNFPDRPDSPEMLYRETRVYKKMKRPAAFIRSLERFIRRFKGDSKQARRVMAAYGEIMNTYEEQGKPWRFMKREYEKVIRAYESLKNNMQPTDIALTRRYPGKAAFRLAMKNYEAFVATKITTRKPKRQSRELKKKIKDYADIQKEMANVAVYKSPPWLLCAMYYIAAGKQNIVKTIQGMPLPKIRGIKWTQDAKDIYKEKLDNTYVIPLEDQAKKLYQKAVARSQKLHYENKCTNQAYEALHRMDPNIPLPKKTNPQSKFEPLSPMPLIRSLRPPKKPAKKLPAKKKRSKLKAVKTPKK